MKQILKNKKIGLALSGGAALGAAHIGALRALDEFDIHIDYIAGTSIGAFIAAFSAFNKKWDEIETIAKELKWLDVSSISLSRSGLLSNKKLGELITDHIGDMTFSQASVPLAMVATDITNGDKIVMREGNLATAVMASTCIPGIFSPVEHNGKLLVDGGIVENVPISPLKDIGADYIIAIDLNAKDSYQKPNNILEVLLNSFHFTLLATSKIQTSEANLPIKPDLSSFNRIDTDQTEDLIQKGYEETKKELENL